MLFVNMGQVRTTQLAMSDATLVGNYGGFYMCRKFSFIALSSCMAIQAC